MKTTLKLMILGLALLLPGVALAGDEDALAERDAIVPGEVLVRFRDGTPPGRVLAAARGVGASHVRAFPLSGVRLWRIGRGLSEEQAIQILSRNPHVEFAEPNHVVTAHDLPDDPLRGELWGLHNVGQLGGTPDADIDAPEAWDVATDAGTIVVGVIDTGIDYLHEDLAANMWRNPGEIPGNGIDDDNNGIVDDVHGANFVGNGTPTGDPMDDNGHGTHTAGTVGAVGNNGVGVVGVCWRVKLMALKFLNAGGSGSSADAIEAIEYAASFNVRVTSNSWGGGRRSKALERAIEAAGALFVASAGNSGTSQKQYPAGYALDQVIAVAATDAHDLLASFSNRGDWVHLAAPGVGTLSCVPGNAYAKKSGTSMAAPHVAGAAALVMASTGGTNAEVKDALLTSVDPVLPGLVATGGRLNLLGALGGEPPPTGDTTPPDAVLDLAVFSVESSAVTLTFTATGDDGGVGQASLYDLRYATSEIVTEADWEAASRALGEPLPGLAGTAESIRVEGLEASTQYWFALQVLDEAGNASPLSNVVSATTAEAPPGAWSNEDLDASGGFYKALDFHGGAGPFPVGCAHSDADTVVALLWDGSSWLRETVDPSSTDGAGIDFAFAPDGTPTASYGWGKIRFAWRKADGTWETETIEKGRANNDYTALVYDPATGEPTVAYRKGNDLRFARKVGGLGGTWQVETVEPAGARYQDLVYDAAGRPVIAYSDDPDGDGWLSALKVATKTAEGWDIVTLREGVVGYGVYASIAVDADGNLLAADSANGAITAFRRASGGAWDEGTFVANGSALHAAFDGAGTPYISFSTGGRTWVAFHDGAVWQTELVREKASARTDIRRDPDGGLGVLYGLQGGGVGLGRK